MFEYVFYTSVALYELFNVIRFVKMHQEMRIDLANRLANNKNLVINRVTSDASCLTAYNENTLIYDSESYRMIDFVFEKYVRYLQNIPKDSIFILQYPVYTIFNLLFNKRFFLFYPPNDNYIFIVKNVLPIRIVLGFISMYLFPIQLKVFLGILYSAAFVYKRSL